MEYIDIKTSGDWTIQEWNSCFINISKIYDIFLALEIVKEYEGKISDTFAMNTLTVSKVLGNIREYTNDNTSLRINKIQMASPGAFVLMGNGKIIKALSEFFITLLELFGITTEKVKIKNNLLKEDLKAKQLKNKKREKKVLGDQPIEMAIFIKYLEETFKNYYRENNCQLDKEILSELLYESVVKGIIELMKNGKLIEFNGIQIKNKN